MNPAPISPPRTWAEINLEALKHNLSIARQNSSGQLMTVLKAGAYGHDLKRMSAALETEHLAFYGVASVIEARKLASIQCQTRIYLLGPTFAAERAEIVAHRWTPSISTISEAQHFNELNASLDQPPLRVHITVDTGMGRGGFLPEQLATALAEIKSLSHIIVEGIGSHLPSADEDEDFTIKQIETFDCAVEALDHDFTYIHISNSAGILDYRSRVANLARPGLMLYGISPIQKYQEVLKPVLSLKSRISLIRTLPQGHGISYGRSTILQRDTRVATIGIGYGDGYPRSISHQQAEVSIQGVRCPLLGRVTMDQIMVDLTDLPQAQEGDEVELFGSHILASEIAEKAGTIPWEIFTSITPRVTKIYL